MKASNRFPDILSLPVFWITIIGLITFMVYLPALQGAFTNWDDMVYIKENPYIKDLSFNNLRDIFSTNFMGNYHPLSMLSLTMDYQVYKFKPFGFHLTNILIHIINSILVFFLIRRLTGKILVGAFAGLLFGVHAFHVESVAWISERKDVLYTCFFLLSIIAYQKFIAKFELKWYLLSIFFFLLSCLSKGQAVTLAVSLLLIDYFSGRKLLSLKVILEKAPYLLLAFIFGIVAIKAQAGADATIMANFPFYQRFAFASYGLTMYVLKLLYPFALSAYYPYPIVQDVGVVPFIYWLSIIPATLIVVLWLFTYKRSKFLFFGLGFFLLNIVLLLQLLPVGRAIMADRYVYIPSIGYCFLIAWYLNDRRYMSSAKISYVVFILYVTVLGYLTLSRTKVWANSETLWTDVLEKNSQVPLAWYNRGNVRMDSSDFHNAIADYTECLNVDHTYWKAYINRGNAKNELKNYIGAVDDFNSALIYDTLSLSIYVNRAMSRKMLKDYDNSLKDYNKAISLKPQQVEIYTSRANLKYEMKNSQGAIDDLSEAIRLNPNYIVAYSNRAIIKKNIDDFKGALEDYNTAIQLDPQNSDLLNNRANLRVLLGDSKGALEDYSESIRLKPDQYLGYKNRGVINYNLGNYQKAIDDYTMAIQANPASGEVYFNIALVKQKSNDREGALLAYKKAVELDPGLTSGEFNEKLGIRSKDLLGRNADQLLKQGLALESKGKYQEAMGAYKQSVELKPDFAEGWYNLGNLYGKTGKFTEAMNCMDNAIRFKGNYTEALSSRGIAYASMGKTSEAIKDLTSSINADPKYAAAYYNRAIVYLNLGKKDLACMDLHKAIELGYTAAYSIFQKECKKK